MKNKMVFPIITLIIAMLACNAPTPQSTPTMTPAIEAEAVVTEAVTETPTAIPPTPPPNVRGPGFAAYTKVLVKIPSSSDGYESYTLPVEPSRLGNYTRFSFSAEQESRISQDGFVVAPADWLEFYQLYESVRYDELPVFITTDSVYHVYHLIFDKMLRDLEREHFEPDLRALTTACLQSALAIRADLQGSDLADEALWVAAYFAVADALLNPQAVAPAEVADLVAGELALIEAHAGLQPSVIFNQSCPADCDPCDSTPPIECLNQPCMCEDYSQYVPRGHYTRSEQLQRYFRAMMWYGRINMRLESAGETRMALLITHILRNTVVNGELSGDVWARIYDPTVFIVGKSDDLGFHEYGALWDAIFGPDAPPSAIADESKFNAFVGAARQLPPPQINSMWVYIWEDKEQVTQGFRFMGQRFVIDAYIFEELTWREVGEMGNERWLPKGLDVMAAMGSEEAYTILEELGETAYPNYPEQMQKLRGELGSLEIDSWTQNLYWTWLYSFHPLLEAKGAAYPPFMQTQAWARKDIHTALGSWTELKHDTILYAKQVMAEMGGGPPPEPPHGWVEPNPEAYGRLLALTRMTQEGLESRGILTDNTHSNLMRLDSLLVFLLDAAERELAGEALTTEDYHRIKHYGGELEAITLAAADQDGEGRPFFEDNEGAALVADVATDPNGYVLEEAIGRVFEIYVVVPDGNGGVHLAQGGVFSYYEFPWPMGDRLTNETWREMIEAGETPDRPEWTTRFIVE